MSHELRTPLTGVLGMAEALQAQTYGPLNARQLRSLQVIESSGRHLLELINDILDLSKIEAGQFELNRSFCSIEAVCRASLLMVSGMAHEKDQALSFSITPAQLYANVDPRRLKQMLVNLLSNAVKFTPEHEALGLEVEADGEAEIRLTVWDTGIGIAADGILKLFQPFTQLDSSLTRQYTGSGLGLALVRKMAELHGGRIEVQSEPGRGSRFSVILPWGGPELSI
jgi:signal transduction histidine kinase